MELEKVKLNVENNIAVLTLSDPDVLNAVSVQMIDELNAAIDAIADNGEARVLVLTGEGRGFCAGANLADRASGATHVTTKQMLEDYYHPFLLKLRGLDMPYLSAVNGVAAGIGMSIAVTADIVTADRSAYFLQAFARIGLVPDGGSTYLLPRLIGWRRAFELSMLAEKLPAEKALEWGLINTVTDDGKAFEETMKLAERLAKGPTKAYAMARELFWQTWESSYEEQLQAECDRQVKAGETEDSREGVLAFLEKRPANFKGK